MRTIRIAQIPRAQRRLPNQRQADYLARHATVRNGIHFVGLVRAAASRRTPHAHQLGDQHGLGFVVADVIVVHRLRVVVVGDQVALGIQATPHLERERRPLGVPGRLFVPHPLHANRTADLFCQISRLEARVISGGAAEPLRPFHPDHAHLLAWHLQKRGDAVAHAIRLHVVRVDRHLPIGWIGHGMGGSEGRVALERDVVLGFDHLGRTGQARFQVAYYLGFGARSGLGAAHVFEQIFGRREGRGGRLLPVRL